MISGLNNGGEGGDFRGASSKEQGSKLKRNTENSYRNKKGLLKICLRAQTTMSLVSCFSSLKRGRVLSQLKSGMRRFEIQRRSHWNNQVRVHRVVAAVVVRLVVVDIHRVGDAG